VCSKQASRSTGGRPSAQVGLKEAAVLGDVSLLKEARDCNISEAAQRSAKAVQLTGSAVVSACTLMCSDGCLNTRLCLAVAA
jgi:hypothetical protein